MTKKVKIILFALSVYLLFLFAITFGVFNFITFDSGYTTLAEKMKLIYHSSISNNSNRFAYFSFPKHNIDWGVFATYFFAGTIVVAGAILFGKKDEKTTSDVKGVSQGSDFIKSNLNDVSNLSFNTPVIETNNEQENTPEKIFCPYCGAKLSQYSKFCDQCGQKKVLK